MHIKQKYHFSAIITCLQIVHAWTKEMQANSLESSTFHYSIKYCWVILRHYFIEWDLLW